MEYEVRYYFSKNKIKGLINKLDKFKDLNKSLRTYEKTIQYDHPNKDLSFYRKEIDGRFRIRISKNDIVSTSKISWKKRLSSTRDTSVNKEEEIEVNIDFNDYDNLIYLINNVLKLKQIESYERYRTIYYNNDIEIAIDEYPFGIALEIENKRKINEEKNVQDWTKKLGLNIEDAYRLSWDDKYTELCKSQNIKAYKDVTFDKEMPEIIDR